jgi:hypothetical protein
VQHQRVREPLGAPLVAQRQAVLRASLGSDKGHVEVALGRQSRLTRQSEGVQLALLLLAGRHDIVINNYADSGTHGESDCLTVQICYCSL